MSELKKVDGTLSDALRAGVSQNVAETTRRTAVEAISWFADRPGQDGLDWNLAALKLAAQFHRLGATREHVLKAIARLERSDMRFRPTVADYVAAVEHVQREELADEFARLRWYYPVGGDIHSGVLCLPETAERLGLVDEPTVGEPTERARAWIQENRRGA